MPWHQQSMKDVEDCVKPRGVVNHALIRGCPNEETHTEKLCIPMSEYIGHEEATT